MKRLEVTTSQSKDIDAMWECNIHWINRDGSKHLIGYAIAASESDAIVKASRQVIEALRG